MRGKDAGKQKRAYIARLTTQQAEACNVMQMHEK
jgi:hypothetical protein